MSWLNRKTYCLLRVIKEKNDNIYLQYLLFIKNGEIGTTKKKGKISHFYLNAFAQCILTDSIYGLKYLKNEVTGGLYYPHLIWLDCFILRYAKSKKAMSVGLKCTIEYYFGRNDLVYAFENNLTIAIDYLYHDLKIRLRGRDIRDMIWRCYQAFNPEYHTEGLVNFIKVVENVNQIIDKRGNTILHSLIKKEMPTSLIIQVLEKGGNLYKPNRKGITPYDLYMTQCGRLFYSEKNNKYI